MYFVPADDIRLMHETSGAFREEAAAPTWKGFVCDVGAVLICACVALGVGFGAVTLLLRVYG